MRLLKQITLLLMVIALLGGAGCAKKRIGATYDPFFLFPATAQWSWDEHLNQVPDNPSIVALNVPTIVRELITEGLAKRGYVMVPKGTKVDFRVHYQVGIGRRVTASSVTGYGSLSLTLVDDTTNRDVWLGFVRTESDVSLPESERRKRLKKQINTMLKKFPPS
jgi:hypothetical protein